MKKFHAYTLTAIIVSALVISACVFGAEATVANAATSNAEVISPNLDNYVYIENPQLISSYDGKVAVYDKTLNKVVLTGAEAYDCPTLSDTEYLVKLTAANGTLYALTSLSRLYDFEADAFVSGMDSHASTQMVCGNDGKLYLYNGLNNLYCFDGATFTSYTDSTMLTFNSEAFAVVSSTKAYFINDGALYLVNYATPSTVKLATVTADKLFTNNDKAYLLDAENISVYDNSETPDKILSDVFQNDISILEDGETGFLAVYGNEKAVYTYSCGANDEITFTARYGCSGSEAGWYDSPAAVEYLPDGSILIWDKGNKRFSYFNKTASPIFDSLLTYDVNTNFTSFAANSTTLFLSDGRNVFYAPLTTENSTLSFTKLETEYNIGAFTVFNDNLYVYDTDSRNIYYANYLAEEFEFKYYCVSMRAITKLRASGGDNPLIYGLSSDKLTLFSTMGSGVSIDVTAVTDFAVDYTGNLFILKTTNGGTTIGKFTRTANGFTEEPTFDIVNLEFTFKNINSFTLAENGTAYAIDSAKNVLIKISDVNNNDKTFANEGAIEFSAITAENISYAKSKGAIVFTYLNNRNIVSDTANSGKILAVLDDYSSDDVLCVIAPNGKIGYIDKTDTVLETATELTSSAVKSLHDSLNLYNAPTTAATSTAFTKSTIFTVIDNAADFSSGGNLWYYVCYLDGNDEKFGYVLRTRVMTASVITEAEKPVYVKAKAPRVGVKVNVYALQDTASPVLVSVTDGAKLKLLESYDANSTFTLVEYDGISGYVLTAEILADARLTSGQIAAIVLACITLLITAVYFLIFRRNRKLNEKR